MSKLIFCSVLTLFFSSLASATNWQNSWESEKSSSARYCAGIFANYQLQAVCMDNERKGYRDMQGNFGFSSSEAQKAKARCAEIFEGFQLQAVCMQNEQNGYQQMLNY